MPSPFPGMDPYLEGALWGSVHAQLIAEIARQLAPRLRPRYIARVEKRFVLDVATQMADPAPQTSVEIRDVAGHRLVVVIELLSPANKRGEGRNEYIVRRQRFLQSSSHLLEIDLLRGGQRVPMLQKLPDFPYFVFLSRAGRRPMTEVWPISLDRQLPTVPVPLLAGDSDVPLELQRALDTVYDLLGYDLEIDYSRAPEPPLNPMEAQWAQTRIREESR